MITNPTKEGKQLHAYRSIRSARWRTRQRAAMDSTGGQTTCRWPCPPRKSIRKEKCIRAGEDTRLSGIGLVHTRGAEKRERLFFPFGPQPQLTLRKMDRIRFSLASTAGQHLEQGAQSERNGVSGKMG